MELHNCCRGYKFCGSPVWKRQSTPNDSVPSYRSELVLSLNIDFRAMDFTVDPVKSVPREFLAVILAGFGNE